MDKRPGEVTMHGKAVTLLGPVLKIGEPAPDFTLLKTDMSEVHLSDFAGKTVILSVTPSLDTPVCDLQAKRFNQEARGLANTVILNISMDLPFAQKRWCGAVGADNIITLSDHRTGCFGAAYGVLIDGMRLLARAVLVIGPDGDIKYIQLVPEITEEPDYDAALAAARA
ncbi:MAG: thiol peroxidase [Planctomycetes bacterium]|nr:thiol peroxidase [Planctomycetota bacterium]